MTKQENESLLLSKGYKQEELDNLNANQIADLVKRLSITSENSNDVRNFAKGLLNRTGQRAEFLNRKISFPLGTCTLQSFFCKKEQMADIEKAEKVFCSLRFTADGNSVEINDDWAVVNAEFRAKNKSLVTDDGKSIPVTAGIEKGVYQIPA